MLSFVSCPHRLHLQGRSWTVVVGSSLMSFPFPHTGQIAHPSFETIVADSVFGCNDFSTFLLIGWFFIPCFEVKNY